MSGNHIKTMQYGKNVLSDMGFKQDKNTTIFIKNEVFCLSPSVQKNKSNYYWFDIREANIKKYNHSKYSNFIIIVRVKNKGYIFLNFKELKKILLYESKLENSKFKVWSFKFYDDFSYIYNKKNNKLKIPIKLLTEFELKKLINQI
ncbi:hypothetical protein FHQ18_09600 [Deferribacter autotrophicus]|uniref:Uncharacterized protein n=1 Tax=Deferribacter autotrophicus TaxID=500465 RepID=A0A5A8F6H7_9BACT|nr:hypothetical protein [Deferribacter autotrophicus]KAA0257294.1 hypothetical protein FHQ18_09600 [Deferribacter autotrophicus]